MKPKLGDQVVCRFNPFVWVWESTLPEGQVTIVRTVPNNESCLGGYAKPNTTMPAEGVRQVRIQLPGPEYLSCLY